jgi:hypothetical protein
MGFQNCKQTRERKAALKYKKIKTLERAGPKVQKIQYNINFEKAGL